MRIFRDFIWAGFMAIFLLFTYYNNVFTLAHVPGIIDLEFARASTGENMLATWQQAGLLRTAAKLIWVDFAFVFFYVAVIVTLSNRQIRNEPSIAFNALLRANFILAVLAGLLDVAENTILLYNIYRFPSAYLSTYYISLLKFILVAWCVFVWLVSFARSRILLYWPALVSRGARKD